MKENNDRKLGQWKDPELIHAQMLTRHKLDVICQWCSICNEYAIRLERSAEIKYCPYCGNEMDIERKAE